MHWFVIGFGIVVGGTLLYYLIKGNGTAKNAGSDGGSDGGDNGGGGGGGGGGGCFAKGTLVAAEGGAVPIEEVDLGSKIYSCDKEQVAVRMRTVVGVSRRSCNEVCILDFGHGEIVCTRSQKFLCKRGLVRASDLKPGDTVKCRNGGFIPVNRISMENRPSVVFHLLMGGKHGYYVTPHPVETRSVAHEEEGDDGGDDGGQDIYTEKL
ncbi:MAG: Hint domain-containing protein [Terracidiphilus sp.]|jgi:hypothetical protein